MRGNFLYVSHEHPLLYRDITSLHPCITEIKDRGEGETNREELHRSQFQRQAVRRATFVCIAKVRRFGVAHAKIVETHKFYSSLRSLGADIQSGKTNTKSANL